MKVWQKYQDYLFRGEWHIHTNFTDGKNSVSEYAERAVELGIPLLAFTEHVRLKLQYSFDKLLNEIEKARKRFPRLIILSGCEAKVLPDGTLDCCKAILDKVDHRLFAFHSFPADIETYLFALNKVVKECAVDAWAHPGLFFRKHKNLVIGVDDLQQVFEVMNRNDILLEKNCRYDLPSADWLKEYLMTSNNKPTISGWDVHSVNDLDRARRVKS